MDYPQCITDLSSIYVSSPYGWRTLEGQTRFHGGIDTVHGNHRAYAPVGGTIVHTGYDATGWGYYIVVQFGDNDYWLAGHLPSQTHSVGESLLQGQFFSEQGDSGHSTGIHTHWEHWHGGYGTQYRTNPSSLIRLPNSAGTYSVIWDSDNPPIPPQPTTHSRMKFIYYLKRRRF